MVIKRILHSEAVAGRKRAKAVGPLHGLESGVVQCGRAAARLNAGIGGCAVALDIEDDGDALAGGGVGIGFGGKPVLRDFAVDDFDVPGVAGAEGLVLDGGAGGAVLERDRRIGGD